MVHGLRDKHKRTVKKWKLGDKIIYYINKIGKFGAITDVTSGYYRDYIYQNSKGKWDNLKLIGGWDELS